MSGSTLPDLPDAGTLDGTEEVYLARPGAGQPNVRTTTQTIANLGSGGGTVTKVSTGALLTGGPFTTAGTVSVAATAADTILANATSGSAVPTAVPVGGGLSFNAGTLTAPSGTVTSVISGAGLHAGTITTTGTLLADWNGGTVTTLGTGLSLTSGTLAASGSGGTVTKISTSGLVTGGDITGAGTISLASQAATTLVGNGTTASAVPTAIPIGSGLAFSSGTLTATGSGGSVTSVVAAAPITGGTITTTGTLGLSIGDGLALNSGTLVALPSLADINAAGSNQATATTITADINIAGTVAASAGVRLLSSPSAGATQRIVNRGSNTVSVYPASGAAIESNSANAAVSVVAGGSALFIANSTTLWYVV